MQFINIILISVGECPPVTLPDLQRKLRDAANQYWLIGCYLNINPQVLSDITRRNRRNIVQCLNEVLQSWFERKESVSWHKVARVMDLILRIDISTNIRREYCGAQVMKSCKTLMHTEIKFASYRQQISNV